MMRLEYFTKTDAIEVGDTVLIVTRERVGWRNEFDVARPVKVEKVTASQFTAGGVRFQRDRGAEFGGTRKCIPLTENNVNATDAEAAAYAAARTRMRNERLIQTAHDKRSELSDDQVATIALCIQAVLSNEGQS